MRSFVTGSCVALISLASLASCSSSKASSPTDEADVKAAATKYAQAFLTGSTSDVTVLQGKSCDAVSDDNLGKLRLTFSVMAGADSSTVHVTGAQVRKLSGDKAEAEVTYDVPGTALGAKNWVSFAKVNGHWLASDCSQLPFLGNQP